MKTLFFRTLFLQVILFVVFSTQIKSQDLNAATLLTRSEQYDKAKEMFNQLIVENPSNSKLYFYLGENSLLEYFADTISNSITVAAKAAKEAYQKGVEADTTDPLNYIGLAKVSYFLGNDDDAAKLRAKARSFLRPYKKIKKISPPAPVYAFALAKIAESYIRDGKVDTSLALPLIREAIKIDNKNRDIYLITGDIYLLVNDGSNAIRNYNLAQYYDPQSPTANMKIGNVYVRSKSLRAAIPYFEEAIALNADYAPAYRELGQLYAMAKRFDQSKEYFEKYLDITEGNIPAKIRYVNALFYAKEYDEVIKNVEEIFAIDKSRTYMNRIAGYSCYEKDPPDYDKALSYMETLFETVTPEWIIWKDHYYMARILLKKNQDYPKMLDELNSLESSLKKAKLKTSIADINSKISDIKNRIKIADKEIDRAFAEYNKVLLDYRPGDKNLLNEMANSYYTYRRYNEAAKTWASMINPDDWNTEEYMRVGRAYYVGGKFKEADSVFNIIIKKSPDYISAYLYIARTYAKMDPDAKLGLAKPKFEKLINIAKSDSVTNTTELMEAFGYLGYYYLVENDYSRSKDYYNRMISLTPDNIEFKIKGYIGIGSLELKMATNQKENEERLPYLARATAAYNKILSMSPNNSHAKSQLAYIREFVEAVKKGINPNEIKGIIRNTKGSPIPYASIRVKDTAAENLTNSKGAYKFEIPQGSEVLIISAKDYETKEIEITKSRVYNVVLEHK